MHSASQRTNDSLDYERFSVWLMKSFYIFENGFNGATFIHDVYFHNLDKSAFATEIKCVGFNVE